MTNILVLHPGALGDIILALPAIGLLRQGSARITVAGNLDFLEVVAPGYADRIISLSTVPLYRLYSGEPNLQFWKKYDRVISWTGAGDPQFVRTLKRINPENVVASWHPGPGETRHVSRIFADSVGMERGSPLKPPQIQLSKAVLERGRAWLFEKGWTGCEPLVAIHPGAGSEAKRWPARNYARLARRLAREARLLIVEGPAETGLARQIAPDRAITAESEPLELVAAAINHCALFTGNDSGVAHLAAALQIRCIVLFGPTLPQHWAPLGDNVRILRNENLNEISVEEVIERARIT